MREILFRAKRIVDNEWYYGSYLYPITIVDKDYGFTFSVVKETVSEYVGLKDKNGTRIFEGDIVKFHPNWNSIRFLIGVVKHGEAAVPAGDPNEYAGYFGFYVSTDREENKLDFEYGESITKDIEYEVIGNIYDNPELIKQ